jgi:hypothetical protein
MAGETEMQKATRELVAALNEAADFHRQRMARSDTETELHYKELAARVEKADKAWLKIFRRE